MGDYNVLKVTMAGYHQSEVTASHNDVMKKWTTIRSKWLPSNVWE